jgi:hypothetical protein
MRRTFLALSIFLVAATVLSSGCKSDQQTAVTIPAGTSIGVTLATPLTSETASVGGAWTGTVRTAPLIEGHSAIPVGSQVTGTVTSVTPARQGDRAMLDLGLSSITVGSRTYDVHGSMESVTAGSTRARNLGSIGAATVAGAVIGHSVGGSDKGTLIGGLIGAGAATAVVSQTKGWQVVLHSGTALTFTTGEAVAVRI